MKNDRKKIVKMTDEIISFLMNKGSKDINFNLLENDDKYILTSSCNIVLTDYDIKYINDKISIKKEIEYDLYWELMGDTNDEDELELLCLLADNVRVNYEYNVIKITVELNKNNLSKI